MRHILPDSDWVKALADIVAAAAADGDTVVVGTPAKRMLGQRAAQRMGKALSFVVAQDDETPGEQDACW